ncbi:MCE family protein [Nocardioides sp. GCM10030258]|uniref:MCE family protein n=1 Tax=unclassified Nocardioides TaxID=2615069 RepID=UPI0036077497
MTTTRAHGFDRQLVFGFVFLLLIAGLIVGTIAKYRGAFEDNVLVTVEADRAGLTLAKGAPIKLRGVEIGTVGDVDGEGETVRIELKIDSDVVDRVPADVTAQIVPPTAFGAKYVQLSPVGDGTGDRIRAGAVIPADKVTVEVNEAFENLTKVLDVARPAEVNAALTAGAGALDQRGKLIGDLVTRTDAYLVSFNAALPSLSSDLRAADDVLDVYDASRPDLIATLSRTGEISDALVRQRASLGAFERSLTAFSDQSDILLRSSEEGIFTSLSLIEPVTRTLKRYAPGLPCLVLGLAEVNKPLEAAIGGTNPGLTAQTHVVPGREPYKYGENLPLIGEDRGPVCFGLPHVTPEEAAQPLTALKTGANPYVGPQPTPSQSSLDTLLGLLAGGVNLP